MTIQSIHFWVTPHIPSPDLTPRVSNILQATIKSIHHAEPPRAVFGQTGAFVVRCAPRSTSASSASGRGWCSSTRRPPGGDKSLLVRCAGSPLADGCAGTTADPKRNAQCVRICAMDKEVRAPRRARVTFEFMPPRFLCRGRRCSSPARPRHRHHRRAAGASAEESGGAALDGARTRRPGDGRRSKQRAEERGGGCEQTMRSRGSPRAAVSAVRGVSYVCSLPPQRLSTCNLKSHFYPTTSPLRESTRETRRGGSTGMPVDRRQRAWLRSRELRIAGCAPSPPSFTAHLHSFAIAASAHARSPPARTVGYPTRTHRDALRPRRSCRRRRPRTGAHHLHRRRRLGGARGGPAAVDAAARRRRRRRRKRRRRGPVTVLRRASTARPTGPHARAPRRRAA